MSNTDADAIPKVKDAGSTFERDDTRVQVMHNGILIEEGCYSGEWMTEVIRTLKGHHEPQEEAVFDAIIRRLRSDTTSGRMIEFGAFWSYYSLWFAQEVPGAHVLAMEPDLHNLEVGRRNAELNGRTEQIEFLHAVVGDRPGEFLEFKNYSDHGTTRVEQYDLQALFDHMGWDRIDLALIDIQGFETMLLDLARPQLTEGKVRFLVISTHHHSISNDPLTHQRCLSILEDLGAHVIAEHSVSESASGDGLIAVSFDSRDADLHVPLSYTRAQDTMFGDLEHQLADERQRRIAVEARLAVVEAHLDGVERSRGWRALQRLRRLTGRS